MTQTLTGLFDSYDNAKRAVNDQEAAGVPHRDVSIVANNACGEHASVSKAGNGAGKGAGIDAALGGGRGLLAGPGLLAIPGRGVVAAAGWLAATAEGAGGGERRTRAAWSARTYSRLLHCATMPPSMPRPWTQCFDWAGQEIAPCRRAAWQ